MDNSFGLTPSDLEKIISVLKQESEVEEAVLFGSRAKGNYKAGSDVDIALKGGTLLQKNVSHISYLLNEESVMPYKFDMLNFNTITNNELVEHINRVGIVLYKRQIQAEKPH